VTRYLQFEDVLRQVARAGFVVRDQGLLAGALARPQASAFGADAYPSLWEKAAALCQAIDNSQNLVDGSRRLAWLVTKVFLGLNGQQLRASAGDGEQFMTDLVAGHSSIDSTADWLRSHSQEAPLPDYPDDEPAA